MKSMIVILLVACILLSGMANSAFAAKIQKTKLSQTEVEDFAQAQEASAQMIDTLSNPGSIVGAFAIIGAVVVALIIIAAVK